MKKLISMFLALAMILSLSTTVFADGIASASERTYNGYQLMTLSTSLKTGSHHPVGCDNINHSSDCYNYAYSITPKYMTILQQEAHDYGRNDLWPGGIRPAVGDVTEKQILDYLSYQTSDSGSTSGTLRVVADRIYRAILAASLTPEKSSMTTSTIIDKGYWMIADITDMSGDADANSLIMVDTKDDSALNITPKVSIPSVEKKVKDIEDSEDGDIKDNEWHDSADHDFGDKVPFKLTASLPSNAQYYTTYKLVFHDTLAAGLTLDSTTVKVLMYDTKYKADVDTDLNDYAKDVTANFTLKSTGCTDGCSFEVSCDNLYAISGVTKDTAFVVYYEATLNDSAVIGSTGNPNSVKLEYSNNPYDANDTGMTVVDTVTVFTYKLVVNKTDSHGHALDGAGFTLYKKNVAGVYEILGVEQIGGSTFTWLGLDDGDYKLVESTVPAGYNGLSDVLFTISATHSVTADAPALLTLDGGMMGTGEVATGAITKAIENKTGVVLPETGGEGTLILVCISSLLVMMAAVFMITRKKMSVYED